MENDASVKTNLVLVCKEDVIEGGWFMMDLVSGSFLPSANTRPRREIPAQTLERQEGMDVPNGERTG